MGDWEVLKSNEVGIAMILARKGVGACNIGARLGFEVSDTPGFFRNGDGSLIGIGPGSWLVLAENPGAHWQQSLIDLMDYQASVVDQSSGYRRIRLAGAGARSLLQSGCSIDLHPDVFGPGQSASTALGHIGVIFWQVDATPTFDLLVHASYAASFDAWLLDQAAHRTVGPVLSVSSERRARSFPASGGDNS